MQQCDTSIVIDTAAREIWCVYEHHVQMSEGAPPEIILVGFCRLFDVYRLNDGRANSEWAGLFSNGGHVLVRVIATTLDRAEAVNFAGRHARSLEPMPRCNLRGFSMKGSSRPIRDMTTNKVYDSQKDAADELGISQSAISRHLRGDLKHVAGHVFCYLGAAFIQGAR